MGGQHRGRKARQHELEAARVYNGGEVKCRRRCANPCNQAMRSARGPNTVLHLHSAPEMLVVRHLCLSIAEASA